MINDSELSFINSYKDDDIVTFLEWMNIYFHRSDSYTYVVYVELADDNAYPLGAASFEHAVGKWAAVSSYGVFETVLDIYSLPKAALVMVMEHLKAGTVGAYIGERILDTFDASDPAVALMAGFLIQSSDKFIKE